ncbi:hypothetical protein NFI96_019885, partial [Prochilodus magdalenae]
NCPGVLEGYDAELEKQCAKSCSWKTGQDSTEKRDKTQINMSDFIILSLIGVLVVCLILTLVGFVFYSGLLSEVDIRTGSPPVKKITIAYKFKKGSYRECGADFTESYSIAPNLRTVGVYYDDPNQTPADCCRYAVGSILSENEEKPDEELQRLYEKFGFRIISFPEVSCAVTSTFPNRCSLSPICGAYRVFPALNTYVTGGLMNAGKPTSTRGTYLIIINSYFNPSALSMLMRVRPCMLPGVLGDPATSTVAACAVPPALVASLVECPLDLTAGPTPGILKPYCQGALTLYFKSICNCCKQLNLSPVTYSKLSMQAFGIMHLHNGQKPLPHVLSLLLATEFVVAVSAYINPQNTVVRPYLPVGLRQKNLMDEILRAYSFSFNERRLAAFPFLEICGGDLIHYMCPLENQHSFFVHELQEKQLEDEEKPEEGEEDKDDKGDEVTETGESCQTESSAVIQEAGVSGTESREAMADFPVAQQSPEQDEGDGQSEEADQVAKSSSESVGSGSSFEELDMDTEEGEKERKNEEEGHVEDNEERA